MTKIYIIRLFSIYLFCLMLACSQGPSNPSSIPHLEGENSNQSESSTNGTQQKFKPQEYSLPQELNYSKHTSNFLADRIRPIGWSHEGRFAYIQEPVEEGSGMYRMEVVVFNAVSNSVEWSWAPERVEKSNFAEQWKANYGAIKKSLNDFEIVQTDNQNLLGESFNYDNKEFQINLERKLDNDEFGYGIEVVKEELITLKTKSLGSKTVAEHKFKNSNIVAEIVSGCLLSPYEDRIVIITKYERIGYEGPPNVIFFNVFGANLVTGFQKEQN